MKKLICFSTLSLAIATMSLPSVAQGQQAQYSPSAPRISSTNGYMDAHMISVYTGDQPLSFITVRPPDFISVGDRIQINDQSGQAIESNISREGNIIRVNFAQPIPPQTTLKITFADLSLSSGVVPIGVYNYEVAGGYPGFRQEIPYGLARVQVF
ncbi:DUF2808 domain-containing protein [Calothrix sp. PCC 7507]|uniref:DUF2808 domain-containing protein n=1 Tax=Calothrix sp. PCC 7507 TaxID=99598 RepID=UPI00029EC485|nr:DUF2808 domain-containing protein [Calothrix sp. PCC 7507]AFY35426.1 hypothetical protein Cal7507_5081 [Calothrix sp. PCC 7507]